MGSIPVELLKKIRTQMLEEEKHRMSKKPELSELEKIKQALWRVECMKAEKRAKMLGEDEVATRMSWELYGVMNQYCADRKFINRCCKVSFCSKERILVLCGSEWKIYEWNERNFSYFKHIKARFISITSHGVRAYRLMPLTFRAKESRMNIFEMGKGERFHKKPQNGGSSLPYQRGLSGGATRREDAEANRVSTWSINITK